MSSKLGSAIITQHLADGCCHVCHFVIRHRCGFDADASVSTIQMLTNIEVRLEECLATVDQLPRESVNDMEKAREKERRQLYR